MRPEVEKELQEAVSATLSIPVSTNVIPIILERLQNVTGVPYKVELQMQKVGLWKIIIHTEGKYIKLLNQSLFRI